MFASSGDVGREITNRGCCGPVFCKRDLFFVQTGRGIGGGDHHAWASLYGRRADLRNNATARPPS